MEENVTKYGNFDDDESFGGKKKNCNGIILYCNRDGTKKKMQTQQYI